MRPQLPAASARGGSGSGGSGVHAAHPALVVGRVTLLRHRRGRSPTRPPTTSSPRRAPGCSPRTPRAATRCPCVPAGSRWPTSPPGFLLATGVLAALVRARARRGGRARRRLAPRRRAGGAAPGSRLARGRDGRPRAHGLADRAHLDARADEIAGGVAMNPYYRCFEAADGFVAVACLNLAQRRRSSSLFGLDDATIDAPDVVPTTPASSLRRRSSRRRSRARSRERPVDGVARAARGGRRAVRPGAAARGDPRGSAGRRRRPRRRGRAAGPRRRSTLLAPFVRVGGERTAAAAPAPALGADTDAVLAELGVRFDVSDELALFAESVRAAIGEWEPPREPELGELAGRSRRRARRHESPRPAGASSGRATELLGAVVAGGIELGRAAAPVSLVDEATLGAPLWVDGRARHARGATSLAVPRARRRARASAPVVRGAGGVTLDGTRHGARRRQRDRPARARRRALHAGVRGTRRRSRTSRASRSARSSSRSSTPARASSSARRSRRYRPCSRGSPTRRSRGRARRCSPGRRPRTTAGCRSRSCAGPDRRAARSRRLRTRCTARSASRSRPGCTPTTGALARRRAGRRRCDRGSLSQRQRAPLAAIGSARSPSPSHSSARLERSRIPPSSAIRNVRPSCSRPSAPR